MKIITTNENHDVVLANASTGEVKILQKVKVMEGHLAGKIGYVLPKENVPRELRTPFTDSRHGIIFRNQLEVLVWIHPSHCQAFDILG